MDDDIKSMPIDEILKEYGGCFPNEFLLGYVKSVGGLENIKREDMDKIINHFGIHILRQPDFFEYYKIAVENKKQKRDKITNWIIMLWTWIVGIATVIQVIITL